MRKGTQASPTSGHEILRADLAAVLYEITRHHPNVEYVLGTTVKSIMLNDEKSVKVELSNGEVPLGRGQRAMSRIRKQSFPPESIEVIDRRIFVVYWTVPRLPSDNDWWNIYHALGSRVLMTRPDPHNTIRACLAFMP